MMTIGEYPEFLNLGRHNAFDMIAGDTDLIRFDARTLLERIIGRRRSGCGLAGRIVSSEIAFFRPIGGECRVSILAWDTRSGYA